MLRTLPVFLTHCVFHFVLGNSSLKGADSTEYKVVKTLHVGGEGGFDFATLDGEGKLILATVNSYTGCTA
jgi:hypothetical protein